MSDNSTLDANSAHPAEICGVDLDHAWATLRDLGDALGQSDSDELREAAASIEDARISIAEAIELRRLGRA